MNDTTAARFAAKPPRTSMPDWYPDLLDSVALHISTGHRRAIAAANAELLATYWSIGQEILTRQEQEGWGAKVIDRLSADLKDRFPTAKGYSPRNLKYMRAFAAAWPDRALAQTPLAQLPWYHHLTLLQKLDNTELRLLYARATVEHGWSRNVLAVQIDTGFHRRAGKAVTNFAAAIPDEQSDLAQEATRDPYLFDFVEATEKIHERELEQGLIDHIGKFLIELGRGFAFVGRQVRLELAGEEFYCDLLFYHLELRCFVVIELKSVRFDPAFLGQLNLYTAVVDDVLAKPGDKPTVGLLLCRSKNNVLAEYALRGYRVPLGVSEWVTAANESLPEEVASVLPSVAELEAELAAGPEEL